MIKTIAFLKRKAELSREAFIRYYETRHAPLILSIAPQICDYRRNFLIEEGAIVAPGITASGGGSTGYNPSTSSTVTRFL